MLAIIFCVFFQCIILCSVFIGCGKKRILSKKAKKKQAIKQASNRNQQQQERLQRSRPSQPLQKQQPGPQSQSDSSLQTAKKVKTIELKKEETQNIKQQQNVETPLISTTPPPSSFAEIPFVPTDEEKEEDLCDDSTSPEVSRSNSKNTPDNRFSKSSDKISLVSVPSTATTSTEEKDETQQKEPILTKQEFINFCRFLLLLSEGKKQLQKIFLNVWHLYYQIGNAKTERWLDGKTEKDELEQLMLQKTIDSKYRENVKDTNIVEWDITTLFNAIYAVNAVIRKSYKLKEIGVVDKLKCIRNETFHGGFGYTSAEFKRKWNQLSECLRNLGMTKEVIENVKHNSENIQYVEKESKQKSTPKKSVTQEKTTQSKSLNKPERHLTAEMYGNRIEVNVLGRSTCGLKNPGALCYMHAILQSLFAITPFRRIIMKANVQIPVVQTLQKLFIKMQFGQIQCDSYDVFVSSKWSKRKNSAGQQDIEEFFGVASFKDIIFKI